MAMKCPFCGARKVKKAGYPHPSYVWYCLKCAHIFPSEKRADSPTFTEEEKAEAVRLVNELFK